MSGDKLSEEQRTAIMEMTGNDEITARPLQKPRIYSYGIDPDHPNPDKPFDAKFVRLDKK